MIMEYNTKTLCKKIDDYFAGIISRTSLGEWAKSAYYDLLKGGYIECEKIAIYPFLKIISTFHIEENEKADTYPCSEKNVKMIQNILHGNRNFIFSVETSIPDLIYSKVGEGSLLNTEKRELFSNLRDMLMRYIEQKCALSNELISYVKYILRLNHGNTLVLDMLEEYILSLLSFLFNDCSNELGLSKVLRLYAQKPTQNIIAERLITCLDCYIGRRNFQVLVYFENGKPNTSIAI